MINEAGSEKELRIWAAEVIAGAKAYDVPALCKRLGLELGSEDEAMRSTFTYARSRLMEVADKKLLPSAKALREEEVVVDFALAALVARMEERGTPHCRCRN